MPRLAVVRSATLTFLYLLTLQVCSKDTGCSFKHDGCTYNILINSNSNNDNMKDVQESTRDKGCGITEQQVFLDRAQNDYTAKIDDIERNFSFLRDTHEQRIKELESTVRELLGIGRTRSPPDKEGLTIDKSSDSLERFALNNEDLMSRLEVEFDKLRAEIRDKTSELIDTRIKLNETSVGMHEAQLKHFRTSQDLLNAENQITMLTRERAILKNQLKDRSYKLEISTQTASECETKSTDQQNRLMELFRSEATITEDLMTTQLKLNQTRQELDTLHEKHKNLKTRHERIASILRIRENELITCYASKTSTFCGFEDPNICGFTNINDTSDFFDWERAKGRTPSAHTGPSKDHTCDTPTGHFMFIEASAKGRGSNAILYSPLYRGMNEQCVEFFYHMNGRHIGTLNVYAQARGDVLRSAWRAYGNQGDVWTNARLAIPQELAMAGYQIAFEGITENGYQGDISIDDVSVTDGPCPVDEFIIPVKVAVNSTSLVRRGRSFARRIRRKQRKNARTR